MKNTKNLIKNEDGFAYEIRKAYKEKKLTAYEYYSLIAQRGIQHSLDLIYKELWNFNTNTYANLGVCASLDKYNNDEPLRIQLVKEEENEAEL